MRSTVVIRVAVAALVLSLFASNTNAFGLGSLTPPPRDPWLAAAPDPLALQTALTAQQSKLPVEFYDRLEHVLDDGTLRIMAVTTRRDATVERLVADNTTTLHWYGEAPRFTATVTQAQMLTLVSAPVVSFVEPDYPIVWSMATSTLDTQARSLTGDGTGVWSFDSTVGTRGALRSDTPGLSVDQATGKGVAVAVNDGGIDGTHKDFSAEGCVPQAYQPCNSRILEHVLVDTILGDGTDDGHLVPTNDFAGGHGTHVAGTVAGNGWFSRDGEGKGTANLAYYGADGMTFGIAPQANLVAVKNGEVNSAALGTQGLQWTLDNAARLGIKVSTNSWGCLGGCAYNAGSAASKAIKDLYNAGVAVIFAAGNDAGGPDGATFSGNSQSPYSLSVAAYNDVDDQLASFSSRGSSAAPVPSATTWDPDTEPTTGYRRPDIAAPGVTIFSARNLTGGYAAGAPRVTASDALGGGTTGYRPYVSMSGTSMATPHVAGAAALLFSACPAASTLEVYRALLSTATSRVTKTGSATKAEAFEVGYGAMNIRPAVDALLARPVCSGIEENLLPNASLTGPDQAQPGETVSFDGSGSNDPDGSVVAYAWDFGDSSTASGAQATHAWTTPGTYTVTLQVTDDDGGIGVATATIEIADDAAQPGLTIASPADGASIDPGSIEITGAARRAPGGGGTLFLVGDGSANNSVGAAAGDFGEVGEPGQSRFALSSTGAGTATTFQTLGPWNVSSWDNPFLPTFVGDEAVELSGNPVRLTVDVTYSAPAQSAVVCPLTARLYSSGVAISPAVDVDAAATMSNQTVVFDLAPTAGSYPNLGVQVGPNYGDCGYPANFEWGSPAHLGRLELAPADALTRTPGPLPEQVSLTLDGAALATVAVDTVDGPASFAATAEVGTGEHEVVATWTDTYGIVLGTATSRFTAVEPNRAPTAVITGPSTADLDVEVAFDASSSSDPDGDELGYLWDFGDGSLATTGAVARHVYETTGTYTVQLIVDDGRGATAAATHQVTVTVGASAPAKGFKRIFAALDTADCGPEWHLILTGVATPKVAGAAVATWNVGTSTVALSSARSTVAHYRSTKHLTAQLQQVSVDVPKSHHGEFFLALAPC